MMNKILQCDSDFFLAVIGAEITHSTFNSQSLSNDDFCFEKIKQNQK